MDLFSYPEEAQEEEHPQKGKLLLKSLDRIIALVFGEGEKQTTVFVHQNILCNASPFFRAACRAEWITEDHVITLPEDNPNAIQSMVYWMYHNDISIHSEILALRDCNFEASKKHDVMNTPIGLVANIYILGGKYQMPELQDDAISVFSRLSEEDKSIPAVVRIISHVYQNTPPQSRLRRLLVQIAKWKANSRLLVENKDMINSEFFFDLSTSFLDKICDEDDYESEPSRRSIIEYTNMDFCSNFHQHPKTRYALKTGHFELESSE